MAKIRLKIFRIFSSFKLYSWPSRVFFGLNIVIMHQYKSCSIMMKAFYANCAPPVVCPRAHVSWHRWKSSRPPFHATSVELFPPCTRVKVGKIANIFLQTLWLLKRKMSRVILQFRSNLDRYFRRFFYFLRILDFAVKRFENRKIGVICKELYKNEMVEMVEKWLK